MPIRVVACDLDDTLCAYWNAAKAGLRLSLSEYAPKDRPVEEWLDLWAQAFRSFCNSIKQTGWYPKYLESGEPTRTELMRQMLLLSGIDDPKLAQAIGDAYAEARDENLFLFDEAIEFLEELKARRLGRALITNGPADIQRQEIATLGVARYFDLVQIEGEMGFGKPDERVFAMTEEHFGADPSEVLMVGNSFRHDILPAIGSGWKTAWIRRPSDVPPSSSTVEEAPKDAPEPTKVIYDLREALDLL